MKTRLFKKPDLRSDSMEIGESVFRDPRELEKLKATVKPEVYLQSVYKKIEEKERELSSAELQALEKNRSDELTFERQRSERRKEIDSLESVLVFKREERTALEKPLDEKWARLNERELLLNDREKKSDERDQRFFEKEHECELRLESIRDMADELGENRVRLASKESQLKRREESVIAKETQYMTRIESWNAEEEKRRNVLQTAEFELSVRQMNLDGKEENLAHREKVLSDGLILLADRRGVLDRAWRELENKYGTTSTASSITVAKGP